MQLDMPYFADILGRPALHKQKSNRIREWEQIREGERYWGERRERNLPPGCKIKKKS